MSSIDDRIVNIKFNNAAFEANIKTTLSSLEKLKSSLNFGAVIKNLGDLDRAGKNIKIKVDNASFDASVRATMTSADNLKKNLRFDGVTKGLTDLDAAAKKINLKLDPKGFQDGVKAVQDGASQLKASLNFDDIRAKMGNLSFKNVSFQPLIEGAGRAKTAIADIDRAAVFSNLQGAAKNVVGHLGGIQTAAQRVDLSAMASGVEDVRNRFGALEIAGIAALGAIGAKAAIIGAGLAKSLFIDNPRSGLMEYETNLNSIQTILANTQSKGSDLQDVNGALATLNEYSDKTIYNFSEMARNIGTFTAAGVDLDTSTEAIKGISNLAALSGSNSQQASTAMYQLSQAMSTGKVSLMDWNSVVNAGMGGEVFQEAIKDTARNQGIAIDDIIAQNGSFRDSLQEGWLTTEVMTETLSKLTGDLTDDQLRSMGYQDDMIAKIQATATTANDAATKVKTFTQLTGTLQETSGSGWAATMQIILGDFEQAKAMWTSVNDVLGTMIKAQGDRRNQMLGDWAEMGGRTAMIGAVSNAFKVLMGVLTPINEAFRQVFPPMTGERLADITKAIEKFIGALIPGEAGIAIIKNSFLLFFSILKVGVTIIQGILAVVGALFKGIFTGGKSVSDTGAKFSEFAARLADILQNSTLVQDFFGKVAEGARLLGNGIRALIGAFVSFAVGVGTFVANSPALQRIFTVIKDGIMGIPDTLRNILTFLGNFGSQVMSKFTEIGSGIPGTLERVLGGVASFLEGIRAGFGALGAGIQGFVEGGWETATTRVRERLESLGRLGDNLVAAWENVKAASMALWEKLEPVRTAFSDMFKDISENFKDVLKDVDFNDILDLVNVGLLGGLVLMFKNFFKKGLGIGEDLKGGILDKLGDSLSGVKDVLKGLTGTLEAMQQNLQADTLMKIAIAIGVLAASVVVLSLIDSGKLTKAIVAVGALFFMLNKSMESISAMTVGAGFLKIPIIAASMTLLATAVLILSAAVTVLSALSWEELAKGLLGVSVMLYAVAGASQVMAKNPANLIATGVGLIALAVAIKILASAVADFSEISWGDMVQGLVGVGTVLAALLIFNNLSKVNAGAIANAAGLILMGVALKLVASAVADFSEIPTGQLVQGMITLGLVLGMLNNFVFATSGATGMLKTAAAMVILGGAMHVIASAIFVLGSMDLPTLAKGLVAMGVSLGIIVVAMNLMPPNMLVSAAALVVVAAALIVLGQALLTLGGMTWDEIGRGLTVLAGALILISVALIAMTTALPGAAALIVAAGALAILTPVLIALSNLTWEQLLHGLAGLAGIFLVIGVSALVLAPVIPLIAALGVAIALLGVGLFGIGAGTLMFVAAMLALAASAAVVGPVMIALVASILALIPMAMEQLGLGIVAFAEVISGAGPVFLAAMTTLIMTLLIAIQTLAPEIANTLGMLITELLNLLGRSLPEFLRKGLELITALLSGIADNIGLVIDGAVNVIVAILDAFARNLPRIIESGANLIVAFLDGIGNEIPKVLQAGADLVIDFLNGIATTIDNNAQALRDAGGRIGIAIVDGMTGGLGSKAQELAGKAAQIASDALESAKSFLGIASPSKEFFKVGAWSGEGMVNGLDSMRKGVARSSEGVGRSAMDSLRKTMTGVAMLAAMDVDSQPVIRPVLDLTDIKANAPKMNSLLKAPTLRVSGSYAQAVVVAEQSRSSREADVEAQNKMGGAGNTYNFVQNNTSPKALDTVEIYRKTNSQISRAKGVLSPNATVATR